MLLGRKAMTNIDSVFKSRDHFADKGLYSQSYDFSSRHVQIWYESWTIKKGECQTIDVFKLWRWRRLLRVPWTSRRPNKSILNGINPEYSMEGVTLKLKFQYFRTWCEEPTHWKRPWCWERLRAGGEGGDTGRDGWRDMTQWTWVWANSRSWW